MNLEKILSVKKKKPVLKNYISYDSLCTEYPAQTEKSREAESENRVSNSGWPVTGYVEQAGLELMEICLFLPWSIEIKGVCQYANIPNIIILSFCLFVF